MSDQTEAEAIDFVGDMLTFNSRKTSGVDTSMKSERGRGAATNGAQTGLSIGPILRERREAMGVTLAEAEVATRIRQKYLSALESDEWDLLPGEVVGRGFLRNYATYLGLEPTEMIERRRAVADASLASVLADTSAGAALPPERKVDYRPKDMALRDEGDELETSRRLNLAPFAFIVGLVLLILAVWWGVTQLAPQFDNWMAAIEGQIAAWQQPAPTPVATQSLPENLIAPTADAAAAADQATSSAGEASAPAVVNPATEVAVTEAAPPAAVAPTPTAQPTEEAVSLTALLPTPTPTPQPAAVESTNPATANTAANLRGGPSTDFPIVGGATEGQTLTIIGRNADGTWYALEGGAWIFAQLVDNAPADLPEVAEPPLPAAGEEQAAQP
ncbi:MAG: helix-turn-helix domain-containing protein [Caldilineaceae bacterium]|nr:helix-turn-helix domain-containing protein [Caldilineaceae bacterium]